MTKLKKGDYVLATKYADGDPRDHWGVGFFDKEEDGRIFVVHADGATLRANGFRRAAKISRERGTWLLCNSTNIEMSGRSMWHFRRCSMNK